MDSEDIALRFLYFIVLFPFLWFFVAAVFACFGLRVFPFD